jgi:hypothetical protein
MALASLLLVAQVASCALVARQLLPSHVYWTQPDQNRMTRDVASLRQVLPALAELRLADYRNQDWCRSIAYSGGRFSNTQESTCNLFDGATAEFTIQADADFARVADALDRSGVWVYWVSIQYDEHGRIVYAEFDLVPPPWIFVYWSYVFDPGAPLPEDTANDQWFTRIDSDWYFRLMDWM